MIKSENFLDYANLLSLNIYEKNNKMILKCFQYLKNKNLFYD